MTSDQMNREVLALWRRFAALWVRYVTGERSGLYAEARGLTDEVVCLLDEAPEDRQTLISGLAQKCEALLRSITH